MKLKSFEIVQPIHSNKHAKKNRWFVINRMCKILLHFEVGTVEVIVYPGFETDGRSGGRFIDWLFPHWGTQKQRACVLVHDVLYYGFMFGFDEANDILRQMMLLSGTSRWRADLVYGGVMTPIAKSKFGNNTKFEEDNKKMLSVHWI